MQHLCLIFSLWLILLSPVIANEFSPPEVIEDLNPKSRNSGNPSRQEGWVFVNYIIDIDGKAKHIKLIDSSEKLDIYEQLNHYLDNRHYSPATMNKKQVPSAETLLYYTEKSLSHANNKGVTRGFRKHYKLANNHLEKKQFVKAKAALDNLHQNHSKNIKEQALSALLHSQYYFSQSNWDAYGKQSQIVSLLKDTLPAKSTVNVLQSQIQWHVFKKEYAAAFIALASLKHVKMVNMSESVYQGMYQDLLKLLQDDSNIEVRHTFTDQTAWLHKMSRQQLSLTWQQGSIDTIELRCKNNWRVLTEAEAKAFIVNKEDIQCDLLIQGASGTKISLIESGELYRFTR